MPNTSSSQQHAHVVIIGAGFGGLNVAKHLRRASAAIALVDRHNYHLFQPLLYQVATGELEPSNIATPIRRILRKQKNVTVALGEVTSVDLEQQMVRFDGGEIGYDYLVIATGVRQSYFGHDEYRPHAPGLKSIDDALELRRRLLLAFEEAEWEADEAARRAKLTFVVVGGGPTGVELAGAIKDIASEILPTEFRNIRKDTARVIIVDGGPRLVAAMPEDLGERARKVLEKMGVEIHQNTRVTGVTADGVQIGDELIAAENVFWAAGVQGHDWIKSLGVELDRAGRVVVGFDMAIAGHSNVFVIGDAAHATDANSGNPVPGLAQGAIQTGKFVAEIIRRELDGASSSERPAFNYYDKGSMAIIGRGNAIVAIGKQHFGGLIGWLAWCFVHLMFLVGFGNKVVVMADWFWNFLRHKRHSNLITGDPAVHVKQLRAKVEQQDDSDRENVDTGS